MSHRLLYERIGPVARCSTSPATCFRSPHDRKLELCFIATFSSRYRSRAALAERRRFAQATPSEATRPTFAGHRPMPGRAPILCRYCGLDLCRDLDAVAVEVDRDGPRALPHAVSGRSRPRGAGAGAGSASESRLSCSLLRRWSWVSRGDGLGGRVVVRCRQGHVFTTIWIPGASLKAVRLGWMRFQRCPVGGHWALVTPVIRVELTDERRLADQHHDVRIP